MRTPQRSRRAVVAPLVFAVAFSCFYLAFIAWSPGARYAGSVGPFSNPSVLPGALLLVALVLAVRRHLAAARVTTLLAGALELIAAVSGRCSAGSAAVRCTRPPTAVSYGRSPRTAEAPTSTE